MKIRYICAHTICCIENEQKLWPIPLRLRRLPLIRCGAAIPIAWYSFLSTGAQKLANKWSMFIRKTWLPPTQNTRHSLYARLQCMARKSKTCAFCAMFRWANDNHNDYSQNTLCAAAYGTHRNQGWGISKHRLICVPRISQWLNCWLHAIN